MIRGRNALVCVAVSAVAFIVVVGVYAQGPQPVVEGVAEWRVDTTPVTRVESLVFAASPAGKIRDVVRMDDGGLMLAIASQLQVFNASGAHVRDVALPRSDRVGYLSGLQRSPRGEILAWMDREWIVMSPLGTYVRTDDARATTQQSWGLRNGMVMGAEPHVSTIGPFHTPYDLFLLHQPDGGRVYLATVAPVIPVAARRPFAVTPSTGVTRDHLLVGVGTDPFISVFTHDGEPLRRIALRSSKVAVTQRDVDLFIDLEVARALPGNRPALAEFLRKGPRGIHRPYYEGFVVDEEDNIWIRDYAVDSSMPSTWTVIDLNGRELARINLPAGFVPRQIDRDHITGVNRLDPSRDVALVYAIRR